MRHQDTNKYTRTHTQGKTGYEAHRSDMCEASFTLTHEVFALLPLILTRNQQQGVTRVYAYVYACL